MLSTRPALTGSTAVANTIGIVLVTLPAATFRRLDFEASEGAGQASRTAWDRAVPTGMAVKFARLSAGGEWIRTFSSAMRLRRRQRGGGVTPSDPDVWPWARSLLFDFAP